VNCRICGAELPADAMFCGECGSSTSATPESRRRPDPRPGDTTRVDRLPRASQRNSGVISVPVDGFRAAEPIVDPPSADPRAMGAAVSEVGAASAVASAADAGEVPVVGGAPLVGGLAVEPARPQFSLRFSTGETRTVFGSGLIGRKPMPQPGERFDHLVQIADHTLSVSKTHLEFGEHEGGLWVADRFSSNGTVVRRPDDGALRCEPGRRYLVPRGSRIEMAEQYFSVD